MTTETKINLFLAIFNGIMVGITIWLVTITMDMSKTANRSLDHQISKDSIDAINDHVRDSLNQKAQIRRDSIAACVARFETRAYVNIKGMQIDTIKVGSPIYISVEIENVGKTPAFKCRFFPCMESPENPNGAWAPDFDEVPRGIMPEQLLFPGIPRIIAANSILSQSKSGIDNILLGKKQFFVYGKITYNDIWGQSHFTKFCSVYDYRLRKFIEYSTTFRSTEYSDAN
jgi:hypothetical protein